MDFDNDNEGVVSAEMGVGDYVEYAGVIVDDIGVVSGINSSLIFLEGIREGNLLYNPINSIPEARTIAHEIGHQFGLGHGNGDVTGAAPLPEAATMGLMYPFLNHPGSTDFFCPRQLNLIRSRISSPGFN